jgi:predicted amidohydrolase YtcJ
MYLASLINKGREVYKNGTTDPTALPAESILKMATVNGAKAVLWDNEIGSLEVGKKVGFFRGGKMGRLGNGQNGSGWKWLF